MAKFITLEGIEGVGKTTNLLYIEKLLKEHGHSCVVTREPGGTPLGESLRNLLLQHSDSAMSHNTELLLVFAARAEHLSKVILPALKSNKTVLCDRFTEATYAYQGAGRGIDVAKIEQLEQWVQENLRPDLSLIFDAPVSVGRARAGQRSVPDRIEKEQDDFFQRVRQGYLQLAKQHPQRICLIDAVGDVVSVQKQIKAKLIEYHILK